MKDAFGGAFMLHIMIAFFVVFICFMTVAVSFARAYSVKNGVMNILEDSVGENINDVDRKIEVFLDNSNYAYENHPGVNAKCSFPRHNIPNTLDGNVHGVCVVPHGDSDSFYYVVSAYIVIDFPLFNFGTVIPIRGETTTFVR